MDTEDEHTADSMLEALDVIAEALQDHVLQKALTNLKLDDDIDASGIFRVRILLYIKNDCTVLWKLVSIISLQL